MESDVLKCASFYVAYLRYLSWLYQNNHWISKGKEFYGAHLLFERLYNEILADLDAAAERMVGLYGADTVNLAIQVSLVKSIEGKSGTEEMFPKALAAEEYLNKFFKHFLEVLGAEGSLGLDDLIRTHASNSESRMYLLKQSLG